MNIEAKGPSSVFNNSFLLIVQKAAVLAFAPFQALPKRASREAEASVRRPFSLKYTLAGDIPSQNLKLSNAWGQIVNSSFNLLMEGSFSF